MISTVKTAMLKGIEGRIVKVETDLSRGMPFYSVVGLGDTIIKEAIKRIRAAIYNSGYNYPTCNVTINLSPAADRKEGSHFDLPLAIGLLAAQNILKKSINNAAFFGELSLDGQVTPVKGILPLIIGLEELGIKKVYIPFGNAEEASLAKEIKVIPVKSLKETVNIINELEKPNIYMGNKRSVKEIVSTLDFSDVKGQGMAKRALTVAAAGVHGVLLRGSPGSGKTMMAERIKGILPEMSCDEKIESTKIYSVAGLLNEKMPIIDQRPFRMVPHNITLVGLLGGGNKPKPGEISLAHNGVLFMDEIPQFENKVIEALRGPLESESVKINRKNISVIFPAKVILIATANLCKCGYAEDPLHECTCSAYQIQQYNSKLSGPFLERIDICIQVGRVEYENINDNEEKKSKEMKKDVVKARKVQTERYKSDEISYNSQLTPKLIDKYCYLDRETKSFLSKAYEKLPLSMRTYHKVLKVARTIADIEESEYIKIEHVAEAIQYRGKEYENK